MARGGGRVETLDRYQRRLLAGLVDAHVPSPEWDRAQLVIDSAAEARGLRELAAREAQRD